MDASDQELQQYLFDLQGYLVIHNVLGAAEVAELNRLIDAQRLPSPRERSALAPPPACTDRIMASSTGGSRSVACWIMRRSCQFFAFGSGTAFGWTVSTGSACTRGRPWGPCTRTTGLRRATPSRSQESAFTLLPTASTRGSRSRPGVLPMPDRHTADSGAFPGVTRATSSCRARSTRPRKRPPAWSFRTIPAGSVVLFSEAVMHGTAPWRADHERRTLLYKYCVSQMAWSRARVLPPPDVPLTPRQQALLTEPADPHTFVPSLFSDGPGAER